MKNGHDIADLLQLAGASPDDLEAEMWLSTIIESIPSLLRAKSKARPQADRNEELEAVRKAALELKSALGKLDHATSAEIDDLELVFAMLDAVATNAESGQKPARKRVKEGNDEAMKLLIGFALRHGNVTPSAKPESRFWQFARAAFEAATGEDSDPTRSITRVLQSGYADVVKARIAAKG